MFNDHTQSAGRDKTDEVSFQNGPNSCQNPEIDTFRGEMSGCGDPRHTPGFKRFYLQNLDGRVAHGTEKEVLAATGLSRQLFYQLRTGRTEYAKHWRILYYEETGLRKTVQPQGSKRKYILFFRDKGPVQKGTKADFVRIAKLDPNLIYSRIRKNMPIPKWKYQPIQDYRL